ncbi:hypothetical protein HBI46_234840 [Parastagonospora nodorum]|nr:hypothetical protein HBH43_078960 [Parastagonospora nodorum]KAH5044719.1 hypothetical protein HBI75_020210 [Parastagonospora nodorum]KAH5251995.1 hypothetical protein HBI72_144990 [Parastagonospora nodorum]KAH5386831.1 hypothetical protein HBI33_074760 [Parastagonospora nodorum]KAH5400240.1 hypothetical protein HBI46_234840 [Parastagonospora nodorum]
MALHYLRHAAFITILAQLSAAQRPSIIPEDLAGGLSGGTDVQVSYTGEAVNGFSDGTSFSKEAVAQEPTFALGDSAGIAPGVLYTIIMVDTTCSDKRVLHYARANFKNNFDITNINTTSPPQLEYKAPGAFGETGDNRQYSFLMYVNPRRQQIDNLQLPAEGEAFDVEKFQTDNNFQEATGGVGMVVKLGGQADCAGGQPNELPSNLPSARPPRSSAANAGPTSSAAGGSGAVTSASQRPTPVPSASPNNSSGSAPRPSDPAAAPSQGQDGAPASTVVLSSAGPNGAVQPSRTPSANPAEQTANAALSLSAGSCGFMAPMVAMVGLALW